MLRIFVLICLLASFGCTQQFSGVQGASLTAKPDPDLLVLSSVIDLKFWVKASSISPQLDGSAVAIWTDGSSQSHNGTQSIQNLKPILKLNRVNQLPALHFDGNQRLLMDASFLVGQDFTIFAVGARESGAHENMFIGGTTGAGLSNLAFGWRQDVGGFLPQTFNFAIYGNDAYGTANVFATKSFELWTGILSQTNGKSIFKNGVLFNLNAGSNSALIDTTGTMIGYWPLVSQGFEGDIAELLIYTHALSPTDQSTIEAYLKSKYGL